MIGDSIRAETLGWKLEAGDWSQKARAARLPMVLEGPEYSRKARPISVPDKIGISYVHVGHKGRKEDQHGGGNLSRRDAEAQSRKEMLGIRLQTGNRCAPDELVTVFKV
jgi:hypothetical protein